MSTTGMATVTLAREIHVGDDDPVRRVAKAIVRTLQPSLPPETEPRGFSRPASAAAGGCCFALSPEHLMTTTLAPAAAPSEPKNNGELTLDNEPDQFDEIERLGDEEASDDDESTDDGAAASKSSGLQDAARAIAVPIPPPEPRRIVGLIRGLAEMVAGSKGTLVMAVAALAEGQILVTIQPPAPTGDKAADLPALQVKGSAAEIDEQLLDALGQYVPAVEFAVKTAAQVAAETTAAATAAAAKRPTPSASPRPAVGGKTTRLTVKVKPRNATLSIVDAEGTTREATHGTATTLGRGKCTITASADGFASQPKTVTLSAYSQNVALQLMPNVGFLTVKPTPKDCALRVVDAKGELYGVTARTRTKLVHGKYTVEVSAANFETQSLTATVGSTPAALEVSLIERPPALFQL